MARSSRVIAACLCVTVAAAQDSEKIGADAENAIRKLVATNESGWNSHDMNELGSIFHNDAELINVVGMRGRREYNTIRPHSSLGYRPQALEATQP